jgi:hypothetical protein
MSNAHNLANKTNNLHIGGHKAANLTKMKKKANGSVEY